MTRSKRRNTAEAPLLVSRGGIGEQRSQLGRWADQPRATPFKAVA